MTVCDKFDVQVRLPSRFAHLLTREQTTLHSDTLNESGFVEDTIAAFKGRTIHTYHTEGAGSVLPRACQYDADFEAAVDMRPTSSSLRVTRTFSLPRRTRPVRIASTPWTSTSTYVLIARSPCSPNCRCSWSATISTVQSVRPPHLTMLLTRLSAEDIAFAESRIRAETVAAEDVLHDMGAISMISSDAQAMGRVGEVVSRTWRTASKMKSFTGPLKGEQEGNDNLRVKRYIAKYTINPFVSRETPCEYTDFGKGPSRMVCRTLSATSRWASSQIWCSGSRATTACDLSK